MITVGVAAYNAAATLPHLLDSILAQEYSQARMEVVVADNGSTDDTSEVVRRYARLGPVRLVQANHRRGPAVGRNAVIAVARGEFVAFTDADCVADPRWLAEIEAGFADPTVGCVAGAILPGEPRTATERFYARRGVLNQESVLAHPFLPYAQTANAAFRTRVFRRVGNFDEDLITGEDADLQWRMQLETDLTLLYRPEAVVWHRHRGTARGLLRQTMGWGIGQARLHRKYRDYLPAESWKTLFWEYRRLAGLGSLTLRRWIGVQRGRVPQEALEEAYLSLLFYAGIKLGRWRGSVATRSIYL